MSVVTCNRHEGLQIHFARVNALLLHTSQNILLVVVGHVDGTYEIVGIESLQSFFELSVTHISLERVVGVGVAMTHESDHALLCSRCIDSIQLLGYFGNIHIGVVQQRHTQEDCLILL